jgi:hypothetical protein
MNAIQSIRKCFGWQILFLKLYPTAEDLGNKGVASLSIQLVEAITDILMRILLDSFDLDKKGWRMFEETAIFSWLLKNFNDEKLGTKVIRDVLTKSLKFLRLEVKSDGIKDFSTRKMVIKKINIRHF